MPVYFVMSPNCASIVISVGGNYIVDIGGYLVDDALKTPQNVH